MKLLNSMQMDFTIKSSKNGTWSEDGRVWRLCVLGPSGTKSLTFIFTRLKLFPGETLEISSLGAGDIYNGGAAPQHVFTAWSPGGGGAKRVSAPIAGTGALLTLTKVYPATTQGNTRINVNQIKISAVLQGFRDIFTFKNAATNASLRTAVNNSIVPQLEMTPNLNVSAVLADSVNDKEGYGLACLKDAGCYKRWHNATQATVMLLLTSPAGGRTCTGTLIAGPDPADQLIATANHCREDDDPLTIATLWAAVFSWGGNCPTSATDIQYLSASQVLTGLEIEWSDEYSDVMILRLKNEIPNTFTPYYMGWDASTFPQALDGSGTVHYAGGGPYKKLTTTSLFLKQQRWKTQQFTHVVASWTDGVTQEGSSGATLVDMSSGLGLGVLTGGPEPSSCKQGADMFGTFYAAFQNGLGSILGGTKNKTMSPGRFPVDDGPGIILELSEIILPYHSSLTKVNEMKLSDPPSVGETLTATITSIIPSQISPFMVYPQAINFTSQDWNVSRSIFIGVQNVSEIDFPQSFQLDISLTSDTNTRFRKIRMVQGISVSKEAPAGVSSTFPVLISGGSNGINANDTGSLVERSGQSSFIVNPGDLLAAEGTPLGSIMYYNLSAGETVELNIAVCGRPAPLQVVVYNDSRATW